MEHTQVKRTLVPLSTMVNCLSSKKFAQLLPGQSYASSRCYRYYPRFLVRVLVHGGRSASGERVCVSTAVTGISLAQRVGVAVKL